MRPARPLVSPPSPTILSPLQEHLYQLGPRVNRPVSGGGLYLLHALSVCAILCSGLPAVWNEATFLYGEELGAVVM